MDLHQVFRTRRILTAAALVVALSLGTVGAAGLGQTSKGDAGPLPGTFRMAEARVGDRGEYVWDHVVLDAAGNATVTQEHAMSGFAWLPPKPMRDQDGRLHDTNTLHTWGWQECTSHCDAEKLDKQGWERYAEPVYAIDRTDLVVVSYSYVSETATDPNQTYGGQHMLQSMLQGPDDNFLPPCGPYSPFQGLNVPLDGEVLLFSGCSGFSNHFPSDGVASFKAVGTQDLDGRPAILFTREGPQMEHVWYDPSVPVPLRIAVQSYGDPHAYDVLRLTKFARGTTPLVWGGSAPLSPAPVWQDATLVGKLPDETGVQHPFPASAALKAARDLPEAKEFFAVLDKGYVSFLRYAEFHHGDDDTLRWEISASDGSSNPAIMVSRETRVTTPPNPLPWPLPTLPVPTGKAVSNTTIKVEATKDAGGNTHPDPSAVAATAPTVASMFARWKAFASDEYAKKPANAWGFRIICGGRQVERTPDGVEHALECPVAVESWAGHDSDYSWSNGTSMSWSSSLEESYIPGRGHEATLHESTYRWNGDQDAPAVEHPALVPKGSEMTLSRAWSWVPPNAYVVAGTGAAALFVGLAYLLWPLAKGGGLLGLFSRVHAPDEVVGQPVRKELLRIVEANPGIHLRELQRQAKLSNSQVVHHVAKLRAVGAIRVSEGPGYSCLYIPGALDPQVAGTAGTLKSDAARRILRAAVESPGIGVRELSRDSGLSTGTLSHHLDRMRAAGLLAPGVHGIVATDVGLRAARATA